MTPKVVAAEKLWELQQARAQEARVKAEAEANTLKAKRRKAKLEALAATTEPDGLQTAPATQDLLSTTLTTTLAPDDPPPPDTGPVLPQYGGLPGLLVHDCGASILVLPNPNLESGVAVAAVPPPPSPELGVASMLRVPVVLPEAEAALKAFLGAPHNFEVGCAGHQMTPRTSPDYWTPLTPLFSFNYLPPLHLYSGICCR